MNDVNPTGHIYSNDTSTVRKACGYFEKADKKSDAYKLRFDDSKAARLVFANLNKSEDFVAAKTLKENETLDLFTNFRYVIVHIQDNEDSSKTVRVAININSYLKRIARDDTTKRNNFNDAVTAFKKAKTGEKEAKEQRLLELIALQVKTHCDYNEPPQAKPPVHVPAQPQSEPQPPAANVVLPPGTPLAVAPQALEAPNPLPPLPPANVVAPPQPPPPAADVAPSSSPHPVAQQPPEAPNPLPPAPPANVVAPPQPPPPAADVAPSSSPHPVAPQALETPNPLQSAQLAHVDQQKTTVLAIDPHQNAAEDFPKTSSKKKQAAVQPSPISFPPIKISKHSDTPLPPLDEHQKSLASVHIANLCARYEITPPLHQRIFEFQSIWVPVETINASEDNNLKSHIRALLVEIYQADDATQQQRFEELINCISGKSTKDAVKAVMNMKLRPLLPQFPSQQQSPPLAAAPIAQAPPQPALPANQQAPRAAQNPIQAPSSSQGITQAESLPQKQPAVPIENTLSKPPLQKEVVVSTPSSSSTTLSANLLKHIANNLHFFSQYDPDKSPKKFNHLHGKPVERYDVLNVLSANQEATDYFVWIRSGSNMIAVQEKMSFSSGGDPQLTFSIDPQTGAISQIRVHGKSSPESVIPGAATPAPYDRIPDQYLTPVLDALNTMSRTLKEIDLQEEAPPTKETSSLKEAPLTKETSSLAQPMTLAALRKTLPSNEIEHILAIRAPLREKLSQHFTLDDWGYITGFQAGATKEAQEAARQFLLGDDQAQEAFGLLLYQVSNEGDAAYAEDIRTTLAGMNIEAASVEKTQDLDSVTGKAQPDPLVRPHSYGIKTGDVSASKKKLKPPAAYQSSLNKSKPAYLSSWDHAIWRGNRDYRRLQGKELSSNALKPGQQAHKIADKTFTPAQLVDYTRRVERIRNLHQQGLLLGRVANTKEVRDFTGHRYEMENDILSTTLWFQEGAEIEMQLFSEYGTDTVGVLLDHSRAGTRSFGVSFPENAGTAGSGFIDHQKRRKTPENPGGKGASSIFAEQGRLKAIADVVKDGGSIHDVTWTISDDGTSYDIQKPDARSGVGKTGKDKKIRWNEQTYYRGIEKDFFTALFVKSDSDSFSKELKTLFELQDRIRRKKGVYVPIFQFKGATNQLEEIVPDPLLLNLTASEAEPIPNYTSPLCQKLASAGITPEMALKMTSVLKAHTEAQKKEAEQEAQGPQAQPLPPSYLKPLFDLQLLMFNMKSIAGSLSIPVKEDKYTVFKPVRMIDNLHLVFPTIHKTQNLNAQHSETCFTQEDMAAIEANEHLKTYLQHTLKSNLTRFLGIVPSKDGKALHFDPDTPLSATLALFDKKDPKKSDFAKVLARAMQAAILFQVYGKDTNQIVENFVKEIREENGGLPYLGITPNGVDMILGSEEMQQTLQHLKQPSFHGVKQESLKAIPNPKDLPIFDDPLVSYSPLNPEAQLPSAEKALLFLASAGISSKGKIDFKAIESFQATDPHLLNYEVSVVQAVQTLSALGDDALATTIIRNLRESYPSFGKSAEGQDDFATVSDKLALWIQQKQEGSAPHSEFPFPKVGLGAELTEEEIKAIETEVSTMLNNNKPVVRVRGEYENLKQKLIKEHLARKKEKLPLAARGRERTIPVSASKAVKTDPSEIDPKDLRKLVKTRNILPELDAEQLEVAKELGFVDSEGTPLWEIDPKFNNGKPDKPYLSTKDILGTEFGRLLTGPATDPVVLEQDKESFTLEIDSSIFSGLDPAIFELNEQTVQHLITHTLVMTTEGDEQVLRPNGLQFSQAMFKDNPGGADNTYHPGNQRHLFHFSNEEARAFLKGSAANKIQYGDSPGLGNYTEEDLEQVETLDKKLLSDIQRRLKRAALLASAYITITAEGGYGSERKPLDKAHRVLYVETAGAQFEKYGRGTFTYQDGTTDTNELEASDFIIKKDAAANPTPLFPSYYKDANGQNAPIPAREDIAEDQCSKLNDHDFTKPYVILEDGSLFNRNAFQESQDQYLCNLVIPNITKRLKDQKFYLKATLFGGGFFAKAKGAGDLRPEVVHATLKSYLKAIENGLIPEGSAIEFPRYGELSSISPELLEQLKAAAQKKGVQLIWTPQGDMCDFKEQTSLSGHQIDLASFEKDGALVLLGAADPMSWSGNEPSSASVEACLANNSNLRLVMNWWANAAIFKAIKQLTASRKLPSLERDVKGASVTPTTNVLGKTYNTTTLDMLPLVTLLKKEEKFLKSKSVNNAGASNQANPSIPDANQGKEALTTFSAIRQWYVIGCPSHIPGYKQNTKNIRFLIETLHQENNQHLTQTYLTKLGWAFTGETQEISQHLATLRHQLKQDLLPHRYDQMPVPIETVETLLQKLPSLATDDANVKLGIKAAAAILNIYQRGIPIEAIDFAKNKNMMHAMRYLIDTINQEQNPKMQQKLLTQLGRAVTGTSNKIPGRIETLKKKIEAQSAANQAALLASKHEAGHVHQSASSGIPFETITPRPERLSPAEMQLEVLNHYPQLKYTMVRDNLSALESILTIYHSGLSEQRPDLNARLIDSMRYIIDFIHNEQEPSKKVKLLKELEISVLGNSEKVFANVVSFREKIEEELSPQPQPAALDPPVQHQSGPSNLQALPPHHDDTLPVEIPRVKELLQLFPALATTVANNNQKITAETAILNIYQQGIPSLHPETNKNMIDAMRYLIYVIEQEPTPDIQQTWLEMLGKAVTGTSNEIPRQIKNMKEDIEKQNLHLQLPPSLQFIQHEAQAPQVPLPTFKMDVKDSEHLEAVQKPPQAKKQPSGQIPSNPPQAPSSDLVKPRPRSLKTNQVESQILSLLPDLKNTKKSGLTPHQAILNIYNEGIPDTFTKNSPENNLLIDSMRFLIDTLKNEKDTEKQKNLLQRVGESVTGDPQTVHAQVSSLKLAVEQEASSEQAKLLQMERELKGDAPQGGGHSKGVHPPQIHPQSAPVLPINAPKTKPLTTERCEKLLDELPELKAPVSQKANFTFYNSISNIYSRGMLKSKKHQNGLEVSQNNMLQQAMWFIIKTISEESDPQKRQALLRQLKQAVKTKLSATTTRAEQILGNLVKMAADLNATQNLPPPLIKPSALPPLDLAAIKELLAKQPDLKTIQVSNNPKHKADSSILKIYAGGIREVLKDDKDNEQLKMNMNDLLKIASSIRSPKLQQDLLQNIGNAVVGNPHKVLKQVQELHEQITIDPSIQKALQEAQAAQPLDLSPVSEETINSLLAEEPILKRIAVSSYLYKGKLRYQKADKAILSIYQKGMKDLQADENEQLKNSTHYVLAIIRQITDLKLKKQLLYELGTAAIGDGKTVLTQIVALSETIQTCMDQASLNMDVKGNDLQQSEMMLITHFIDNAPKLKHAPTHAVEFSKKEHAVKAMYAAKGAPARTKEQYAANRKWTEKWDSGGAVNIGYQIFLEQQEKGESCFVGITVAANAGLPWGDLLHHLGQVGRQDLSNITQEEATTGPVVAGLSPREQCDLFRDYVEGTWGLEDLSDADPATNKKTIQGPNFTTTQESQHYNRCYVMNNCRVRKVEVIDQYKDKNVSHFIRELSSNPQEHYQATYVFAPSVNANLSSGDSELSTTKRTANLEAARSTQFFIKCVTNTLRSSLDAMAESGVTHPLIALLSCGLYAPKDAAGNPIPLKDENGQLMLNAKKQPLSVRELYFQILTQVLDEPVGPNNEQRGQYFKEIIVPLLPQAKAS